MPGGQTPGCVDHKARWKVGHDTTSRLDLPLKLGDGRPQIRRAKRNASPSVSTRHTSAATRSGGPSGGTISSQTGVPVFRRAVVLTFAPCMLMSTEFDRYRFVPASTTTGQESPVRGYCRRFCCRGLATRRPRAPHVPTHEHAMETATWREDIREMSNPVMAMPSTSHPCLARTRLSGRR